MPTMKADELFSLVQGEFSRRGLLGRILEMHLLGNAYSVRCDMDCFSLYRVNQRPHVPPGMPGWTVCRLSAAECFSLDASEKTCPEPASPQSLHEARAWVERIISALEKFNR
ncbi:MAG: hypothetical protein K9K66_06735 [Desulfarculaceae bacterium]|nr:hypothetical protein [Desulfarculaceae bacterium]MCF8071785.1 hypothetical protein [Desulfarculaceae bacterium]MCF8101335.1 hypothetical protein [Desulfarculaceae bacterium]MCF8117294.1 hypothetical protein [Desulfarculaceae bacterium]